MRFPILFDKLKHLSPEDYGRIGIKNNPIFGGEEIVIPRVPREPLDSEILSEVTGYIEGENFQHIFFYADSGSGKSFSLRLVQDYCFQRNIPIILDISHEDIDEEGIEGIRYLIELADVEKVVFLLDEIEGEGFYAKLLEIGDILVAATGFSPRSSLRGVEERFKIFRLDDDYPFSDEQIQKMLKRILEAVRIEEQLTISDELLLLISQKVSKPGRAKAVLGACLAASTLKAKNGKEPNVTENDINCWSRGEMYFPFMEHMEWWW